MRTPTVSRRSLAKGAIWSAPMVLASVAAPAIAASAEPVTMLWSGFPRGSANRIAEPASQAVGGVKIETVLTRQRALVHVGRNWTPTSDGRLEMRGNRVNLSDSEQTVALKFSMPVTDVSLTIEDLDRDRGLTRDFQDEVYIPSGAAMFTQHEAGSRVIGRGSPSDPFRAADDVFGDFNGPDYAVTLRWAGPVRAITIGYRQGVLANLSTTPTVWFSPVTFTPPLGS